MGGGENFPQPTGNFRRARVDELNMNDSLPFQGVGGVADRREAAIPRSDDLNRSQESEDAGKASVRRDMNYFGSDHGHIAQEPNTSGEDNWGQNLSGKDGWGPGPDYGHIAQEPNMSGEDNWGPPEGSDPRASTPDSPLALTPVSSPASAPAILAIPELSLTLPSTIDQYSSCLDIYGSSHGLDELERTQESWISPLIRYLDGVKIAFVNEPEKYSDFLIVIQGFKADDVNVSELIKKLREMFGGKLALLRELNEYLPERFWDEHKTFTDLWQGVLPGTRYGSRELMGS